MYLIIRTVIILYICFAIETILAAENGYILKELDIQCVKPTSAVSSTCSGFINYNIPDLNSLRKTSGSSTSARVALFNTSFINSAGQILRRFGEKCSNAGVKYFCEVAHPFRCEDEYLRVDVKELQARCNEARKDCSKFSKLNSVFNCTAIENIFRFQHQIPRKLVCADFPNLKDDPFTCDANYKVSFDILEI